jgi:general secretion pathway protein A
MYEDYYGFARAPFNLTPDPRFLYRSASHDLALQQVWQAIRRKEGFLVLTGDIGTGKTTLCRTLLEQFDATTFTALILNPFLSVEELLREVLLSFGVTSREALHSGRLGTASKHELVRTLHDFLRSLIPLRSSAVLIIDEAQHLSPEVLEEIRILSNLETPDQKLLQIVLAGQLSLLDILHQQNMRQLDQRVSIRCVLTPLNREEVEAYIAHRLWVARGSASLEFTPAALDLVHALTGGVPRMINLLCDRALMAGREREADRISDAEVRAGAAAIGLRTPAATKVPVRTALTGEALKRVLPAGAAAALLAGLVATAWLVGNPFAGADAAEVPMPPPPPPLTLPAAPDAPTSPWVLLPLTPPPPIGGSLSLLVGRYDNAADAAAAASRLLARELPAYIVDVRVVPTAIERRVLVGRYTSRAEAVAVQSTLAGDFPDVRVVFGWQEGLRRIDQGGG